MLTRFEVDGFKNLPGLTVELGPFTCIAGENGTGTSNVSDAIQFLSLLADRSLMDAAQEVCGPHGERHGDARNLFWLRGRTALAPAPVSGSEARKVSTCALHRMGLYMAYSGRRGRRCEDILLWPPARQ